MNNFINIVQAIMAMSLSSLIFLQLRERQDQTNLNTAPSSLRGWEKITFIITLILLVLFTITSILRNTI